MINLTVALIASFFGFDAATYFASSNIYYSGYQLKWPIASAVKGTPDGSNIWHWTHHFTKQGDTAEVLVDFDKDGKMDSLNSFLRVLITGIQVSYPGAYSARPSIALGILRLESDSGFLWDLRGRSFNHSEHFRTPLVEPRPSKLKIVCSQTWAMVPRRASGSRYLAQL